MADVVVQPLVIAEERGSKFKASLVYTEFQTLPSTLELKKKKKAPEIVPKF